jgi:tetratricopeptide (TPR) repeat protein
VEKALQKFEQALSICQRVGEKKAEAAFLNEIGLVYSSLGQYDKALEYFEEALPIVRKVGDVEGEAATLNNIGAVYKSWGQYTKALEFYEKALPIFRKLPYVKGEGTTLNNIAVVHRSWGQYAKALEFYERSLAIYREIGDVAFEGKTLNNIGEVYRSWGQYAKALEFYQKSLTIKREIGDVQGEGTTLWNMAYVHVAMGQYPEALANLDKALEIYTRIGVPRDGVKDSMAEVYLEMGDMDKAAQYATWTSTLGWLCLLKADYSRAKKNYESLLKRAEENRNADWLFIAYTGLGRVYESLGDYRKAEEYYRKAVDRVEELRAGLSPNERQDFFSVKTKGFYRADPYEGLARVLVRMNRPVEALQQSEYTKARVFGEALSRRGEASVTGVPRDVVKADADLNDQLAGLTKALGQAYQKGNKEVVSSLEPQVKEMKARLAAHIETLRKQHPLYAATRYPQPMSLGQTALRDDEWALEYDVTDLGLLIYLAKGKTLVKGVFKPITGRELEKLVRKVREQMEYVPGQGRLEDMLMAFDFAGCKALADVLLGDVLADIPAAAHLVIVPDGCLGLVPFEMLVMSSRGKTTMAGRIPIITDADFFGDRNQASYYQSLTALTLARTIGARQKAQDKVLVMADPVFEMKDARAQERPSERRLAGVEAQMYQDLMASVEDGRIRGLYFRRLPLTGELADHLKTVYRDACTVYTGTKANKEAFLKEVAPRLSSYGKVVFATHGYAGKDLPGITEPVLVLTLVPPGTDGFLRMSEVMALSLNADVAALTACQTGLGRELYGEGVMGMGRAFQFAGARSVLMSLWSVFEESSTVMVEHFFKRLKEGKSKMEAFRLARQDIRTRGYDHPFFWAPFILVGEAQ